MVIYTQLAMDLFVEKDLQFALNIVIFAICFKNDVHMLWNRKKVGLIHAAIKACAGVVVVSFGRRDSADSLKGLFQK